MNEKMSIKRRILSSDRLAPVIGTLLFVAMIAERMLRVSGVVRIEILLIVGVFISMIISLKDNVTVANKIPAMPFVITLLCLIPSVIWGSSESKVFEIFRWFLFYLYGYSLFLTMRWHGAKQFLLFVRDIVFLACIFGLVFQYILGLSFSTESTSGHEAKTLFLVRLANPQTYRMCSLFSHPNQFGNLLVMVIAISWMLEERATIKYVTIATFIACLVLSGARGATIALSVVFLGILFINNDGHSSVVGAALFGPPLAVLLLMLYKSGSFEFILKRFALLQGTGSFAYVNRQVASQHLLKEAMSDIPLFLFGHGSGAASKEILVSQVVYDDWSSVDSQYASLLYDFGLIPTMFFMLSVLRIALFYAQCRLNRVSLALVIGVILCCSVSMIYYDVFLFYTSGMLFFFSLGLLSAGMDESRRESLQKVS